MARLLIDEKSVWELLPEGRVLWMDEDRLPCLPEKAIMGWSKGPDYKETIIFLDWLDSPTTKERAVKARVLQEFSNGNWNSTHAFVGVLAKEKGA